MINTTQFPALLPTLRLEGENAIQTWQNKLSSVVATYTQWHPADVNDISLPAAVADWVKATTPEMVAALPLNLHTELQASALYTEVIEIFFELETAYRNQNISRIYDLRWTNCNDRGKIARHKLRQAWVENRRKTDGQVEAGVQYYDDILSRCHKDDLYAKRYTLSDKEYDDFYTAYYGITGIDAGRPEFINFLQMRAWLKIKDIDIDDIHRICDLYNKLPDDDKKYFENLCSIPEGNWRDFWAVYEACMYIQHSITKRTGCLSLIATCKAIAGEAPEHYDVISNLVLQRAPTSLHPFITDVQKLIHYEYARQALEKQLSIFLNLQHPSAEQQQEHCTQCHNLIQQIESFTRAGCTVTALSEMQNTFRNGGLPISTTLINYKAELTYPFLNDAMRKSVIRNLAEYATTCSQTDLGDVRTHLAILYPDHFARFNTIAPTELHYTTLLRQFELYMREPLTRQSISYIPDVARDLDANQSNALLTEFRQRFPDFYKKFKEIGQGTQEGIDLISGILETNLRLACRGLESQDEAIRMHSLLEMGEIFALENGIQLRSEMLRSLRTDYPAFRDFEAQALYIELAIKFAREKYCSLPSASWIISCQELTPRISVDQCRACVEALLWHIPHLEQRISLDRVNDQNIWIEYLQHIQRLHDLPFTPERATDRRESLDIISARPLACSAAIIYVEGQLMMSTQGRNLLRLMWPAVFEVDYRDCQAAASNDERENSKLWQMSTELKGIYNDQMTLQERSIADNQLLDDSTLVTLSQRYPSAIQKEEIQCVAFLLLLVKYKDDRQWATSEILAQLRRKEREVYKSLKECSANMGSARSAACIARIQRHLPHALQSQEYFPQSREFKESIRAIIHAFTTSELEYNMHYSISADHYERVRLDDSIPPLPATVADPDTALREGLSSLFNAIPFSELQGQLHDRTTTRETTLERLTTYMNNVITLAPLLAAPNPTTHLEQAQSFWGSIKQIIIHIIFHIRTLEQQQPQSPEKIKKKKIELLARLISSVGHCGGRYKADAVTLYQEVVVGVPKTFLSAIAGELNDVREANARILSTAAEEAMESHEYMGFLRFVGHELAIRGTPAASERYEDPFLTQTRIYATYNNNRAALRAHFETLYTPFTIISCIQQAVGPMGSQDTRDLFWKWCYDNIPIPQDWATRRERSDWGNYYDDICAMDAAKLELACLSSPEATTKYLKSQGIQCKRDQTPEQAIVACELDITKRAYLDAHMYELHPREWSMTNRAAQLRVKHAFIAKILVQIGIISSNS